MPLFEMSWFTVGLIALMTPWLATRAYRMGIFGMWVPQACPPATRPAVDGPKAAKCCEHNPCPDRPTATSHFRNQPWRCPQCRQWWITENVAVDADWGGVRWQWKKVSASAGDGFIEDFQ